MKKKPPPQAENPKKPEKTRRSGKKAIRDQAIIADAMGGMKGKSLAEKYDLSEQTISEILNSPDAKARAELIQKEIVAMVPHALKTLFDSIKVGDYLAARDVLRSTGALQDLKEIKIKAEVTGKDGKPIEVSAKTELKISLEERIKLLKGEE